MREFTVGEFFSILYPEHNDNVKDGAYRQESLRMRNRQTNIMSTPFSFTYTDVDKNGNYGA